MPDLITLLSISGPGCCSVNLVTPQTAVRIDWRYSVFQSLSSHCRKISLTLEILAVSNMDGIVNFSQTFD